MKSLLFPMFLFLASLAPAQPAKSDSYRGGLITPPLPKPRFVLTDTRAPLSISGTELRVRLRSCFSATLTVPTSAPCTWRTLAWL